MAFVARCLFFLLPFCIVAQPDTARVRLNMDVLTGSDIDPAVLQNANTLTSASRKAQEVRDIPFTAYVITAEEIHQRGYTTLVDVLKDLPGIKVSQPGSALHGETFLMRGLFGNYYVKILVDDLPIQPSATSGMPIGAQLPVAQAERIEVIYGPAASIYGADAMAGVINIVTQKPDKPYAVHANVGLGFPGNYTFDATLSGKFAVRNHIWNYMVYGGFYQFNNLRITGGEYDDVYNPQQYVDDATDTSYVGSAYYRGTATKPAFSTLPDQSQKFGVRFGTNKVQFGFDFGQRKTHSAIGANPLYRTYHDPNATFGEQILRAFASYKTEVGQWRSQTNVQVLQYYINPSSTFLTVTNPMGFEGQFYSYAESVDLYGEQFFDRDLGSGFTLLLGATAQFSGNLPQLDLYAEPFDPSDYRAFSTTLPQGLEFFEALGFAPYNFLQLGGIAEVNFVAANTSITAGARLDYREFFGTALNPRLGLIQKVGERHTFRSTLSTAYRPPSSYLVHNGVLSFGFDSILFGFPSPNDSLLAERLWNVDGGWLFQLSRNQTLDFSGYYHKKSNLISRTSASLTPVPGFFTYYGFVSDKHASASLFGLQVVHTVRFTWLGIPWRSTASLHYAKGKEVLPFDAGMLSHYRMQPAITAKWLVEATLFKSLYASVRTHYVSQWRTRSVVDPVLEDVLVADAFYVIDFSLRYTIADGKTFYVALNNLTNQYYYGIGASGGAGVLNNRLVFEDLIFNPQLLRVLKLGVTISL